MKKNKNKTPTLLRGSFKKQHQKKQTNKKNTLLLVKITAEEVAALATSRQQRELWGGARWAMLQVSLQ